MIGPVEVGIELGRELSGPEFDQVQQWVDDAYGIIADHYPDGGYNMATADRAVRMSVARYVSMPKGGESQLEVSVDDARTMRRYSASTASATLDTLLDAWWPLLDPVRSGQAFSISPSYTP